MITVELGGRLLYNIGINSFSILIAVVVYYSYKRNFADAYDIRLLRRTEIMILLVLLADMLIWILDGISGTFPRITSFTISIIFFITEIAVVLGWLEYAWYRVFGQDIPKNMKITYIFVPFTILSLIIITSPFTGWCFYLDDANIYHRGVLAVPLYIILLAYLISVSVIALIQYRKEVLIDRRQELLTIAFFAIPPFLGGIAQIMFYGINLIWPCAVISSLMVLLNKESQAISQDPLTGLNNRRSMEKHLRLYEEDRNRAVTLIVLDINDFKHINDRYGHSFGDMALIEAANILRATFSGSSAFLARYGGDEFVIVMPHGEEHTAVETVQSIKNNFDAFNETDRFPFRLSVSAGYARSIEKVANRTAGVLKEADENMYRDKAQHYLMKESSSGMVE